MVKHKIFLSHVTEERNIAIALKQGIEKLYLNSVEVFVSSDKRSLRSGDKWLDKILEELKNAEIVLVLASLDSINRPWINFEAGGGWLLRRLVVPLCVKGMTASTLPEPLHSLQGINLEEKDDFINFFNDISYYCDLGVPKQSDVVVLHDEIVSLLEQPQTIIDKEIESSEQDLESQPEEEITPFEDDNFLDENSTVFFSGRAAKAFPGIRGLHWINDPKAAVYHLSRLLEPPLTFKSRLRSNPNLVGNLDPIWWFRGSRNMGIDSFQKISDTKVLLNYYELEISKIAVYRCSEYYREFVYVETLPEKSVDIYNITQEDIDRMIESWGYANEEYGWLNGMAITREEYDDGAALIDRKIIDARDAKLRVRYLSKYNFIICAQLAPYNSSKFDQASNDYINGILQGTHKLEDLLEDVMLKLPRHRYEEE